MRKLHFTSLFVVLSCLVGGLDASPGDVDPVYRSCLGQCQKTGCVKDRCFPNCEFSSDGFSTNGSWYTQEPLYLLWKQWDCLGDCRYYCMRHREEEREALDEGPVKYHGASFSSVFCSQSCNALPWLAVLFDPVALQTASETQ